jgi:hypothetical protein
MRERRMSNWTRKGARNSHPRKTRSTAQDVPPKIPSFAIITTTTLNNRGIIARDAKGTGPKAASCGTFQSDPVEESPVRRRVQL